MPQAAAETIAIVALVMVVAAALAGSRKLPEAALAVPLAAIVVALHIVSPHDAARVVGRLGPTVGFLAAILLLAHLCDAEGVFAAAGSYMARHSHGRPVSLLGLVFAIASITTALLSLDATVVLLTPVVLITARSVRLPARAHLYACGHLANSASLLLPVSNLTNLLAFSYTGLSFLRFAEVMAVPWLVTIGVEYLALRGYFRADLTESSPVTVETQQTIPVFALVVLALTLIAFGAGSLAHLPPVWAAAAGSLVLGVRRIVRRALTVPALLLQTNPLFCIFVLALGVIVAGVQDHGLGTVIRHIIPGHGGLPELLLTAAIAAVLANLVNNLPAILLLLAPAAAGGPAVLLAALLGVNIGPNLTYVGSLATLLWRRVLDARDVHISSRDFHLVGVATVPAALTAAVVALWAVTTVLRI